MFLTLGAMARKQMFAAEFESTLPFLKLPADRLEAARLYLVEGKSQVSIGEAFGWPKQKVNFAVIAVWKAFKKLQLAQTGTQLFHNSLPPGWERAEIVGPSEEIARFRKRMVAAYAALPPSEKPKFKVPDVE